MRFVSQYSNFQIQIRPPQGVVTEWGVEPTVQGITAAFDKDAWLQHDYATALRHFQFKGMYQHEDEATPADPTYRIAVYDTNVEAEKNGWDDELREEVERRLLSAKAFGRDYVLVQEIAVEAPWPDVRPVRGSGGGACRAGGRSRLLLRGRARIRGSKWGQQARGRDRRVEAGSPPRRPRRDRRHGLVTDLGRVRMLVRELHRELGLDADQMPKKKKPVEVRYEPGPNEGTWQIDLDEDGVEVHRKLLPGRVITRGMKEAD